MSRRTLAALCLVALVVGAAPMISSPRSGAADLRVVTVVDTAFEPAVLDAYVGDFVNWHFEDTIVHRVSAVGAGFDSGDMSAGQSFAVGFGAPGAYRYYCRYHGTPEGTGMAGVVNVYDPNPASTTLPPSWETTTSGPPTPGPPTPSTTWPMPSTTAPTPVPTTPPGPLPPPPPPPGRPGPTAEDANGIRIASAWEWAPPGRPRYVAGEVVNGGSRPVRAVNIVIDMLNGEGRLLATTWAFTGASFLPPGGRTGFEFQFTPPPGYAGLAVKLSSEPVTAEAPHPFSVNLTNRYTDRYGNEHLVGQVRNDGAATDAVWVLGTFFDGEGHPAGFDRQFLVAGLASGQTGSFEFLRPAHRPAYADVHLATDTIDALVVLPGPAPVPSGGDRYGYWMVGASGKVYGFGDAAPHGDADGRLGPAGAVDVEPSPSGGGYWIADETGRVFPFGDAADLGQAEPSTLAPGEKVTSLAATPTGAGYWMFTDRGRVLVFGDAPFLGDMSGVTLAGPVLDSVITPSGGGYYMVASDGGIFAFGDAAFHGSMGGQRLNAPVQSLVPDADGAGYWLVASDGGIFAFGAPFKGSLGHLRLNRPVAGMVRAGAGYLMVGEDGGIFDFSGEPGRFKGSLGDNPPARPIRAVAVFDRPRPQRPGQTP